MRDVAHVHDGYQVQTNSVTQNGLPGALMLVRKTGGVSTLAVIDGVKAALPDIERLLPAGVTLKPIFDQSIFVKAALNSVIMGGLMAAGLTALMILLFLGNWRLTLIILASIPLSIIFAVLGLYLGGQTLNTMTLGGFALAVGILVDNGTVVIENIERHVGLGEPLEEAILNGAGEVGVPTVPGDLVDLHRVRAGVSADGHGQISVLAAFAVGHHFAGREPGALVHARAAAVQIPDGLAGSRRSWRRTWRRRTGMADRQPRRGSIRSASFTAPSSGDFMVLRESPSQRAGLDGRPALDHRLVLCACWLARR